MIDGTAATATDTEEIACLIFLMLTSDLISVFMNQVGDALITVA